MWPILWPDLQILMTLLIQWNRKLGEMNFINKYLAKIRLLSHHKYAIPMFLKIKFILYLTKMHTLVILLGNFLSEFLKFNYNVTIFNKFATGLGWYSYATDSRPKLPCADTW